MMQCKTKRRTKGGFNGQVAMSAWGSSCACSPQLSLPTVCSVLFPWIQVHQCVLACVVWVATFGTLCTSPSFPLTPPSPEDLHFGRKLCGQPDQETSPCPPKNSCKVLIEWQYPTFNDPKSICVYSCVAGGPEVSPPPLLKSPTPCNCPLPQETVTSMFC